MTLSVEARRAAGRNQAAVATGVRGYAAVVTPLSRVVELLRQLAFPASGLSAEERARLEDERIESNRTRLAGVLPVLIVMQVAIAVTFRSRADVVQTAFRAGNVWIHVTTAPIAAALWAAAWIAPRRKLRTAWLGDGTLLFAVCLGLALSLNTHRLVPNLNAVLVSLFAGTLILRPTRAGAIVAYGAAVLGLAVGLELLEPHPDLHTATLTAGITAALLMLVFSQVRDFAVVRDFTQRLTIARQKSELQKWNAELERRAEAMVTEMLARTDEVRALDAQLRWKVRDRSRELARALRSAAESEGPLPVGSRFERRFEIARRLGSGAMGDVYAGHDHETGQSVALKVLRRWEGLSTTDLNRFIAEAAAAASVVHPAIVRTIHVDISESGRLYQVMELVSGRTLADELERGRFDAAQTARFGAVIAEALAVAHAAGVVHRDIKPSNLILSGAPPGARVLDFGISKLTDTEHSGETMAGQVVGTPLYMAPEQILRAEHVTGAADVYALGQVLYEMLTGEPSFAGRTMREVLRAHIAEAPVSIRSRAEVPDDLAGLIAHCLEKAPEARPDAETLTAALRVLADSLGAPALERIGPPRHSKGANVSVDDVAMTLQAELKEP